MSIATAFTKLMTENLLPGMLIFSGLLLTVRTNFFQFRAFPQMLKKTVGSIGKDNKSGKNSVTPFGALCTALSATIGTGNIAGVAYAINMGGPGAVFWMWIAALAGMITKYAEASLGALFRKKEANGNTGGAMYYLRYGLGAKKGMRKAGYILAVVFSASAIFASFGIGNMSQSAAVKESFLSVAGIDTSVSYAAFAVGILIMLAASPVILGGANKIVKANEKLVPFMAIFYISGALVVIISNYDRIIPAVVSIFRGAFSMDSAASGAGGYAVAKAASWGLRRGLFSNEAGLGSSAAVYAASNGENPSGQGLWGMFEVFFDTVVVCTLTALAILTSGIDYAGSDESLALASKAFSACFGAFGEIFVAISLILFAFSSILGWSFYGTAAWSYLFGEKTVIIYKIAFTAVIILGAVLGTERVMGLSDIFNCCMAIPNLIGLIVLSGKVEEITKQTK